MSSSSLKIVRIELDEGKKIIRKKSEKHIVVKAQSVKTYKLFTYDENELKWKFDEESFIHFSKENSLDSKDVVTPLILFMNSFEFYLISLVSKFITNPQPENSCIWIYCWPTSIFHKWQNKADLYSFACSWEQTKSSKYQNNCLSDFFFSFINKWCSDCYSE